MGKRGNPPRRFRRPYLSSPPLQRNMPAGKGMAKTSPQDAPQDRPKDWLMLALFWGYVLVPLTWGVASTLQKALLLFK